MSACARGSEYLQSNLKRTVALLADTSVEGMDLDARWQPSCATGKAEAHGARLPEAPLRRKA